MLFAMRVRVASDGCSVRLKGLSHPDEFCRGLNGRVQRFSRFRRTGMKLKGVKWWNTKTGYHEKFEPRYGGIANFWTKEV